MDLVSIKAGEANTNGDIFSEEAIKGIRLTGNLIEVVASNSSMYWDPGEIADIPMIGQEIWIDPEPPWPTITNISSANIDGAWKING